MTKGFQAKSKLKKKVRFVNVEFLKKLVWDSVNIQQFEKTDLPMEKTRNGLSRPAKLYKKCC